jgi:two-component system response regulator DesR
MVLSPDTIYAEALSMCLTADDGIEVVGLALEPESLAAGLAALSPAVLLCDQRATGPALTSVLQKARTPKRALKVVLIAGTGEVTSAERAAYDDVVPPRSSLDRVVAAVREVAWYQGDPAPAPAAPTADLSGRELEVLRLLADGVSTHVMATRLHLSEHTIRNHVRRLTAKLGVSSRLEAVTEGRRLGIV